MSSIILHIGAPKTATTFIQNEVMSKINSVRCLVKPKIRIGDSKIQFGDIFCFEPNLWDEVEKEPLSTYSIRGEREVTDILISDEYIYGGVSSPRPRMASGGCRYGKYTKINRHENGYPSISSFLSHLRKIKSISKDLGYKNVKVLITTRRQDEMLASTYAEASHIIRGASQKNFEKWTQYITQNPMGYHAGGGNKLNFTNYYKKSSDIVGKDNVFLIPFEMLMKDQRNFLDKWMTYAGVKEKEKVLSKIHNNESNKVNKRSKSKHTWKLSKPIRRGPSIPAGRIPTALGLPRRIPLRWPDFSREQQISLSERVSEQILDVYEESNRSLDECLPHLDLKRFEYY